MRTIAGRAGGPVGSYTQGFLTVPKKTEFPDKSPINIDILMVFFGPQGSPCYTLVWKPHTISNWLSIMRGGGGMQGGCKYTKGAIFDMI